MDEVEEVDANFLPLIYDILKRFILQWLFSTNRLSIVWAFVLFCTVFLLFAATVCDRMLLLPAICQSVQFSKGAAQFLNRACAICGFMTCN